ncbi:4-hydroxy-tetrahydrodipicolinate synthase [Pseudomonas sessilinigenes]|uniref:4-hydroxy-tetrahydrodipicolinate synthase n=1 Tax=Pseudomonas sessilinigenes TaxID=658629 RepID=A0ABX8MZU9_9PSED|nr:4-hydroxy-tetrahydrodipicolinate synthase [Pseudomonas sessilinigenes]AZC24438.1 Dihydrodipicolinate synthase family protein [Pseudomonas sessilinigenes]QXH43375.1 4-hydroxy-tetrahydrodipicolinate synthase [Pseudomonas sessilinigenes]
MSSFQGIWVPIVTPFHNGAIDFVALRRLASHLLESAVAGLVVCGTTGEAAALDKDEQLAVLDEVLQLAPATRVIMGLAGNNLQELLAMQQRVLERPIAALLVPAPYYIRPSQAALEQFFQRLADASRVPLIVYDIPYRTGVTLNQDTLLNIVRHPRIAAVKDCAGNLEKTLALLASGEVQVLCGEDLQLFSALCLGASGAIAASAHIRPELFVQLHRQVMDQRLEAARTTFMQLAPLIQGLFSEPNPAPVKALLARQGLIEPHLRAPMEDCSAPTVERLGHLLAAL